MLPQAGGSSKPSWSFPLELDIYLPATEIKRDQALAGNAKREIDSVFLRFYAQTCRQGAEVGAPGGFEVLALKGTEWKVVAKQACAAAANTQPELDVTPEVKAVLAEVKAPPAAKPCKPVKCVRAPCPKSTCDDKLPSLKPQFAEIPSPKLTLRIRAAAGTTGEVRLSKATRSEPYEGMTPPPSPKSQNPDEDYVAPAAYLWPPPSP